MNVAETEISTLSDSVGTVFQNPSTQFFNTDTDSEIVFGLENRMLETKELKQQIERVVKDLHIEKLKGCSIFELSGGEKQKIAFASVYATNPDIFVLDEPSSNLDFHSVLEMKKLIEKNKTARENNYHCRTSLVVFNRCCRQSHLNAEWSDF